MKTIIIKTEKRERLMNEIFDDDDDTNYKAVFECQDYFAIAASVDDIVTH